MPKEMSIYLMETVAQGLRVNVYMNDGDITERIKSGLGRVKITQLDTDIVQSLRFVITRHAEPEMHIKIFANTSRLRNILRYRRYEIFSMPVVMKKEGLFAQPVFVIDKSYVNQENPSNSVPQK